MTDVPAAITTIPPAAAGMDRLSDRVGFYYPGGRFLAPRHPIKVSLVMGLLGLASGWLTMILGASLCVFLLKTTIQEWPVFLTAGVVQPLLVTLPWAAWLGARRRWLPLLFAYVWVANAVSFGLIDQFRGGGFQPFGLFVYGFLSGAYLAAAGLVVTRRVRPQWPLWLLGTAVISGLAISSFTLIKDSPLIHQIPGELELPLIVAWFFSLIHLPTALCLGVLLWDFAPLEKRDPDAESP